MKTIGILGGMSATSTQIYYKTLCQLTQEKFGGLNSPELLIRSVNFAPLAALMPQGEWEKIGQKLNQEALNLQNGGADFIILATNTMHKLAELMMKNVRIPLLHIADVTAEALQSDGRKSPAFIATKFTMQERFYLEKLASYGIHALLPPEDAQEEINRIIFEELCRDEIIPSSQNYYLEVIKTLQEQGADSVILGCTEVCLLLNQENTGLPIYDTTQLHCEAALKMAIKG